MCNGQAGWVSAQYLTVTAGPTPTPSPGAESHGTVVNTGGATLRCRMGSGLSFAILMSLAPAAVVQVRGDAENGWFPVVCGNQNGWVSADYLRVSASPSPTETPLPATAVPTDVPGTPTVIPPTDPAPVAFGVVSNTGGATLRCRAEAGLNGAIIASLLPGARVELRGSTANGWIPVICAGQVGWVSTDYLLIDTSSPPDSSLATVVTNGLRANCRAQPSTSSTVIASLANGTQVTILGPATNGWYRVQCANQIGWIFGELIATPPFALVHPRPSVRAYASQRFTQRTSLHRQRSHVFRR